MEAQDLFVAEVQGVVFNLATNAIVNALPRSNGLLRLNLTAFEQFEIVDHLRRSLSELVIDWLEARFRWSPPVVRAIEAYANAAIDVLETNFQAILYNVQNTQEIPVHGGVILGANENNVRGQVQQTLRNNEAMVFATSALRRNANKFARNETVQQKAMRAVAAVNAVKTGIKY